jgi:Tol biopolymer transport system component
MGTRVLRFQWNATGDTLFAEATVKEVRNVWKIRVEPRTLAWLSAERLTTGMGADVGAALSSDGTRLVFTTQRQSVRLWAFPFDAAAGRVTGEGRPVSPEEGEVTSSDLSPDGRTVAYGLRRAGSDRADLWLTHIDSGRSELFAQDAGHGPSWSPDGKMIAYNLRRPDRPPPGEWASAVRELGGAERVITPWSSKSVLIPQDWTPDGRAILGVYVAPLFVGMARLQLWGNDAAMSAAGRVLVEDPRAKIWQGRYSPDGRWLSFVAVGIDERARVEMAVVRGAGAARADWVPLARQHEAPDKPRWSPDGRTIYFLSRHNSAVTNLWGSRFDTERGKPVGEPFMVTHVAAPRVVISPHVELDISAHRALLPMASVTGNIWMLDSVDK